MDLVQPPYLSLLRKYWRESMKKEMYVIKDENPKVFLEKGKPKKFDNIVSLLDEKEAV